jgi:hypothetical protein
MGNGHGGVVVESQKSGELFQKGVRRVLVARKPTSCGEGVLKLVLRAEEKKVDEVSIFAVTRSGARGDILEKLLDIATLEFVELEGHVRKLRLIDDVEGRGELQAEIGARG